MRVLIVEDEMPAAKQLTKLIHAYDSQFTVVQHCDSVESTLEWLGSQEYPDLIMMDIQLADGISFEIFQHTDLLVPVIFTTAYDQYTLKAFKHNSIDYLLKPIDAEELHQALHKFQQLKESKTPSATNIEGLLARFLPKHYKERFVIKSGQQLLYIKTKDISYFCSDQGILYAKSMLGKKHALDYTLDQLESMLNPTVFFRINRKAIIHVESIQKINTYFNSRLKLVLSPTPDFDPIVSRDRVNNFKSWLDQ